MPLFQHSVLKKYLGELDQAGLEAAWQKFQKHFHNAIIQQNILHAKEEEYQEGFVRDLFVNVLGYTLKPQPDYNFVLEQKSTSDATKSDGAILSAEGNVIAVIELKDTTTADLGKVERQAFGYKHQHKDCRYIITSNFQQLRLYINDAIDYEAFDLFGLDKNSFALLYCCLQQKALQSDVPLRMKQQSIAAEENVTKKLYDDYSRFKKQLFENITQQNPQYDPLLLFKKTQKLLDRFLFILFAEDRGLLPPNSVRDILSQWDQLKELDNYVPLYDRFKKYFGYLNTGYKGKQHEIFAYNGGLFAADEILDNIKIDDALLYASCKGLSNYDFESEVDVNILGHIFEHSLNEIEDIEKQLSEGEIIIEKKASKRKKDGVFYTPRYITKYIVKNTVGALCSQKRNELNIIDEDFAPQKRKANRQQLLQKLEDYREWLLQLTICDPACGSGAFLNQALEFLIAEHQSIDALKAKLFNDAIVLSDVENSILENNLYGVDINEEAVEIAKLSLWLRTARKGRKLSSLNNNIKCGNSLIDDPEIAGDKAFNWEAEFPEVFTDQRKYFLNTVDYFKETIVKNKKTPEQLDEIFQKMNKRNFADIETDWGQPITSAKDFIVAAMTLPLHPDIPPMMWLKILWENDAATALMKELAENNGIPVKYVFQVIIEKFLEDLEVNFDEYLDAFPSDSSAGFDVVIGNPPYVRPRSVNDKQLIFFESFYKIAENQIDLYQLFIEKSNSLLNNKGIFSFIVPNAFLGNENSKALREFILVNYKISLIAECKKYVFEDADVESLIFVFNKENSNKDSRYFELHKKEFIFKSYFDQNLFFQNKNSNFIVTLGMEGLIIYKKIKEKSNFLSEYFDVTTGIKEYQVGKGKPPQTQKDKDDLRFNASFRVDETFKPELRGKNISRYSISWDNEYVSYGEWIAEPRDPNYFVGDKILIRQIPGRNSLFLSFTNDDFIIDQSAFIAKPKINSYIDPKYVLTCLNSKLIFWVFRNENNEFDELFPKIKAKEFKALPIVNLTPEQQLPFIAKADIMLSKNKELQTVKQQLLQLLQSKYEGITFSKKLQDWPGLSFSQFLKELDKQKIKLSLPAQAEWMQYFESEKSKANSIQQLINKTDKEIDEMVYELYGLTEEERRVVEEG